jgi:cell fate regulator YaaT (PSP1 superfamily)
MRQTEAYKDMLSLLIITGQIGLCALRIFFTGKPGHLFEVSYHKIQQKQHLLFCKMFNLVEKHV